MKFSWRSSVLAGLVAIPAGFACADGFMPWTDVLRMADEDADSRLSPSEILNFGERDHYTGFQPFMADHFARFDFNGDGYLSFDECRKGMKQSGYSDEQVVAEFKRDHGFRPWSRDQ